jgi:hypothetical protein
MSEVIEAWFRLRDAMMRSEPQAAASALRPPSLRDACYACALAKRSQADTTPETIESFVNGLEMGAMFALQEAWEAKR